VWFESLKKSTLIKFNAIYFRLLRIATKDVKRKIPKSELLK